MNKETYSTPTIELIKIEVEGFILAGSNTTLEVDPIPDNGGIDFETWK